MRELTGKRIVLTGASSGIGSALAKALIATGARVALAARSVETLYQQSTALGEHAIAVPTDVTLPQDRARLIETVVQTWGGIDILINNAGVGSWGHFQTSTEEINRTVLEVNFFAPVELIRLAVPHLTQGNQPAIVNVTSMTGRRGMPAWPEYSASKAALVGMSEALRAEMVRFGIDLVTIVPGLTKSDWAQKLIRNEGRADIPFDKGMPTEYVAERIVDALRHSRKEIVLGSEAKRMLLFNRFAPRLLNRLIARKITRLYS